ncbi:MAG: EamA-like transporter family protein [Hydrocarboniphaga sp.]|uniref:DMT family transporter n=1 Tax=Hydrocarboniphaga sp. TaxID=2033016 RepID=UPI002612A78F|nr:DMT family transporter [Hydrocarboniphaga sp.]MDB5969082.1 EamA-like transporter family protein [Hydrocarboniphaga sp.]
MSSLRKPLDGLAVGLMIVLCACWGFQQIAMKLAAPSLHPVMQNGLRSLIAAILLIALMRARSEPFSLRDGRLLAGLGAGALFAGEFLMVGLGLVFTTASHLVVFVYTAPIFTALGLHFFVAGERMTRVQWLGVLLAFAGIALAFSDGFAAGIAAGSAGDRHSLQMLIGDALGVVGGLMWAATTLLIRGSSLSEAPPMQTLLYQLAVGALLLLIAGGLIGEWHAVTMTPVAWASLAFQGIGVAFASFLAWFWLLRHYLASRLSAFSFLTPLFGVSFGVLLLGDPVDPRFIGGAVLVLAGIALVNLRRSS